MESSQHKLIPDRYPDKATPTSPVEEDNKSAVGGCCQNSILENGPHSVIELGQARLRILHTNYKYRMRLVIV